MAKSEPIKCPVCGEPNLKAGINCPYCNALIPSIIPPSLIQRFYHGKLQGETDKDSLARQKIIK